jgi:hypothetical protein
MILIALKIFIKRKALSKESISVQTQETIMLIVNKFSQRKDTCWEFPNSN